MNYQSFSVGFTYKYYIRITVRNQMDSDWQMDGYY